MGTIQTTHKERDKTMKKQSAHVAAYKVFTMNNPVISDDVQSVLNSKVDADKSHKEAAVTADHYDMAVNQLDVNEGEHGNLFEAMAFAGQQDVNDLAHWQSELVASESKYFYKKVLDTKALAKRDVAIQRVKRVQAAKAFKGSMSRFTSVALDPQGKLRADDAILKGYYRLRNAGAQSAAKLERFNKPKRVSAKMRALLAK